MSYQFPIRQYTDNIMPIMPLYQEFEDNTVVFFEAYCRLSTPIFKARAADGEYPPLRDILNGYGESIFRNYPNLKRSDYRLLKEEAVYNKQGDWWDITETYGFTPTTAADDSEEGEVGRVWGGSTSWVRPGWEAPLSAPIITITNVVWSADNSTQTITLQSTTGYNPGDMIILKKEAIFFRGRWVYGGRSDIIPILSINRATNTIVVSSNFTFYVINTEGAISSTISGTDSSMYYSWASQYSNTDMYGWENMGTRRSLNPAASVRQPVSRDFPCFFKTIFFQFNDKKESALPVPPQEFQILIGSDVVETLTAHTRPTVDEYFSMIAAKKILTANQALPQKFMGDIWRWDIPKLSAQ